jgi:hypothetical protein
MWTSIPGTVPAKAAAVAHASARGIGAQWSDTAHGENRRYCGRFAVLANSPEHGSEGTTVM